MNRLAKPDACPTVHNLHSVLSLAEGGDVKAQLMVGEGASVNDDAMATAFLWLHLRPAIDQLFQT